MTDFLQETMDRVDARLDELRAELARLRRGVASPDNGPETAEAQMRNVERLLTERPGVSTIDLAQESGVPEMVLKPFLSMLAMAGQLRQVDGGWYRTAP